jgi:hypothetical protein
MTCSIVQQDDTIGIWLPSYNKLAPDFDDDLHEFTRMPFLSLHTIATTLM